MPVDELPDDAVTALHFDEPTAADDLANWCGGEVVVRRDGSREERVVLVPSAAGPRAAALGDWIVRLGPTAFRTYDPVGFAARFAPVA